jgi:acyl transferase domain-containing protein/thioesterase domain-containing protein
MKEMKKNTSQTGLEIAVIGMAGRFPGANDIHVFWENLKNGVESVTLFSDEELMEAGIPQEILKQSNYIKAKAYMEDIQYFDSSFFNYTPNEAEIMDPQVRIFHECAWHALEDAGYDPLSYSGYIGLYAGYAPNMYWRASHLSQTMKGSEFLELENLNSDYFATLICYKLNLKGPGVSINTACSTSLVAIHMACRALLTGEADMVLAGGVSITLPSKTGYLYEEGMIMSPDGLCRPFDAKARGTASGNGVGIVVLKRLVKAVKDGDHIYAVIKGTAINNDGNRKPGYTAPSVEAQSEAIRAAQLMAEVEPKSITYVETHGTGTPLGDPIEIEALKKAFKTPMGQSTHPKRVSSYKKNSCALGFVKANIGHLDAAAGVAGFIKTVLALNHRLIPPAVNFDSLNPKIDFEDSPFYINKNLKEWTSDEFPLRAGVSSFGIGGTNAHVVLEEWSEDKPGETETDSRPYQLILLSAKTQSALDLMTENLANYSKKNLVNPGNPAYSSPTLANVAYTLQVGRSAFNYRRMLVCPNQHETTSIHDLLSADSGKVHSYVTELEERPVVFMFPGLGTQYLNMGLGLYHTEPLFRESMDQCFKLLGPLTRDNVKKIIYPSSTSSMSYKSYAEKINQFEITQLKVFIFEYALARLMIKWGIKPHSMIGYSFGEYADACISGVFSLKDVLTLIVTRGKLIQEIPAGAMLSVPLNKETVKPLLNDQLSIAIDNGDSCVVTGPKDTIDAFETQMKEKRYICIRLQASHGLHSTMMDPILKEFEDQVGQLTLNKPQIPFISNVTGKWITPEDAVNPRYWATHLRETVRFSEGLKELMSIKNAVFLEVGPGVTLSTLAYQYIDKESNHSVVNLVRSPDQKISDVEYLLGKIGKLWLYGTKIDWTGFYTKKKRKRVPLPSYPFDKLYYNVDLPMQKLKWMAQEGEIKFKKQEPHPSTLTYTRPEKNTPYAAPRNRAEQILTQMWEELLGTRPIGIHDNLLEMGVNSLKGITFVNRFREQLGEIIHITAIFDAPTVSELVTYFSRHYPESFARVIGAQPKDETVPPLSVSGDVVTIEKIMRFRRFLSTPLEPLEIQTPRNPPAVFVLSPPRTGSTLLRVILGGHPLLFAPPELNLLFFNTLRERKTDLSGADASLLHGTIRAIMQVKQCSMEHAQEILEDFENQDMTVKEFYGQIQEWVGDQLLVDKSPGYSNHLETLKKAERYFQDPLYIHLTRHPYGMIHSFVEAKMDLLLGEQWTNILSLTRREFAEVQWTNSVYNILEFLKQIPQERQLWIRFEDLVAKPEDTAADICRFLHLEFHPEMIQPYKEKKKRMTNGMYSEAQMIGDPKFHRHKEINAAVADTWKQHYKQDFLGDPTLELAEILGYKPIHEAKKSIVEANKNAQNKISIAVSENLWLLNSTSGAVGNIFFIHEISGEVSAYIEFCRQLGPLAPRFHCWGIQADRLKNYTPQNDTIEQIATRYIQKIKKVQPQGPYYLVSWSTGGHIIFEMAWQMEQMGDNLALLGFVDCSGPMGLLNYDFQEFTPETEKSFIKRYLPGTEVESKLEKITNIDHIWPFVVDFLKSSDSYTDELKKLVLEDGLLATLDHDRGLHVEEVIQYLNLSRTLMNAFVQYMPAGKIQTPIHFFAGSQSNRKVPEYWNDYCYTPVTYHTVSGDHYSIFKQPLVKEFAHLFSEFLENINPKNRKENF